MRNVLLFCLAIVFPSDCLSQQLLSPSGGTSRSEAAQIYYDGDSGSLFLDTSIVGQGWSGYGLNAAAGNTFDCDAFSSVFDSAWTLCQPRGDEFHISDYLFRDDIPSGLYELGNIMPAGLSEQAFYGFFASGNVFGSIEELQGEDNVFAVQLNHGPPEGTPLNAGVDARDIVHAENVTMVYDYTSGEVKLESDGEFGAYNILLNDDAFLLEHHSPVVTEPDAISIAKSNQLFEFGRHPIRTGNYSLGAILPPDLGADALHDLINDAHFSAWTETFDIGLQSTTAMGISIVPEPGGALAFVLAAILSFAFVRRLRHSFV